MRRGFGLLALLLSAGVTSAAAAPVGKPAFDPAMGSSVPAQGSRTDVSVRCAGSQKATCSGALRILRGGAPVATKSFKIVGGRDSTITMKLNKALPAGQSLSVNLELSSRGRVVARRPVTLAGGTVYNGSATPKSVKVEHPSRGQGTGTIKIYTWSWTIPAHHYLAMPAWTCPGDAPYVQGAKTQAYGREGKLVAKASAGTGYYNFRYPRTKKYGKQFYMTGWEAGGFFSNSVWAPIGTDGHFDFKATCTDSFGDGAYSNSNSKKALGWIFPWVVD
jgi:hypothetical protein